MVVGRILTPADWTDLQSRVVKLLEDSMNATTSRIMKQQFDGLVFAPDRTWRPKPLAVPVCGVRAIRPTGRIMAIGGIAWAR